jgi:hypothetical protein
MPKKRVVKHRYPKKTRDVWPQFYFFSMENTAGIDEGMEVLQLDIPPVPTYYTGAGRRNVVRELIAMDWWVVEFIEVGTDNKLIEFRFGSSLSSANLDSSAAFSYGDISYEHNPDIFFLKSFTMLRDVGDATGRTFFGPIQLSGKEDLTVDGYGPIMVGNRFWTFMHLHNDVVETSYRLSFKLWYRFIEIELDEYIGLLSTRSLTTTTL